MNSGTKSLRLSAAFCLSAIIGAFAADNRQPLNRAYLQSNMDGNGKAITNLAGLQITTGASNTAVLTSDGQGNATWRPPPAGGGGGGGGGTNGGWTGDPTQFGSEWGTTNIK